MRAWMMGLALLAGALLCGCATGPAPRADVPEHLFADRAFGPPSEPVGRAGIFAMSDEMLHFLRYEIEPQAHKLGSQQALIEALYHRQKLKLEYESNATRNAAQAFEARAGNCLSLVLMTAAFAKEMGITVLYQSAYIDENWLRKGDLLLRSGHVNVTLGERLRDRRLFEVRSTIDFLPPDEIRALKTREIPESLVVAMYMNNRAVEALVQDRYDDAYAWAREAVRTEPAFHAALNTLGVVYLRQGAVTEAGLVLEHVLQQDPAHTRALSNLMEVRVRQGRPEDAAQIGARLARLEPEPPLHYLNLGMAAVQRGDYLAARDLLRKENARGDAVAAVHFWLGLAHYRLGDLEQAVSELKLAAEHSASRSERDIYAAKLEWLRSSATH